MHLYLIRHGQSVVNLPGHTAEKPEDTDGHLTEVGARQATLVGSWLKHNVPEPDMLTASTMLRAQQTAELVAAAYQMPIVFNDVLREFTTTKRDHSAYPRPELPLQYVNTPFYADPFTPRTLDTPDGETWAHVRARTGVWMEALALNQANKIVVAISHGGVINAILDNIFNVGIYRTGDVWIKNTGITHVEFVGDGSGQRERWRVHFVNCINHLVDQPDLIT